LREPITLTNTTNNSQPNTRGDGDDQKIDENILEETLSARAIVICPKGNISPMMDSDAFHA